MAPSATFTWTPKYAYEVEPEFRTEVTEFEAGNEERVSRLATPIRHWRLVFEDINSTAYSAIKAFFMSSSPRLFETYERLAGLGSVTNSSSQYIHHN